MKSPFTGGAVRLEKEWTAMEYRKDTFRIRYHYYMCEDTNERFTTDEIDTLNITQVHNQYRAKYGIPFTNEIKHTRHKYALSAAKMSEVLGFGANVYRQYEAGEMPSVANGRLIKLAEDTKEFRRLLYMSRHALEKDEYEKVLKKIDHAAHTENSRSTHLERWLMGSNIPNTFNGYQVPSLQKVAAMVNFFAYSNRPFLTALNKLLFFADFSHFKKSGYSISGACYRAFEYGPVPENYGAIYDHAVKEGYAKVMEEFFDDHVGERFVADELKFKQEELFTTGEMEILQNISTFFKGKNTRQIVDISHREKGWQHNVNEQNHINFLYGFELEYV